MTAATGRHWLADVVQDGEGAFSGDLADLLLVETAPFEPPTREFDLADIEFARRLDAQIAEARRAEQRRLAVETPARLSWRQRIDRYIRRNGVELALCVAAVSGALFGASVMWLVSR